MDAFSYRTMVAHAEYLWIDEIIVFNIGVPSTDDRVEDVVVVVVWLG